LFSKGDSVLVAVSGGADSVALLCALHELSSLTGISLAVAHLNHGIRGKASDADAAFVQKLAARLKVPFSGGKVDVPALAESKGISMEMAAREARYDFLFKTARKIKATVIATAHTADDQAETILLKLARGAGPRGLAGISPESIISGIRIVRPLLDVSRAGVEEYLRERKQAWREDRTNKDLSYLRNRVRHEVLPFLEKKLNPDIRTALLRTADILREEDSWLEELSEKILKKCMKQPLTSILSPKERGRRETSGGAKVAGKDFLADVSSGSILLSKLKPECRAAKRRVLRQWLSGAGIQPELIDYDVITRVEALLSGEKATGRMQIAGNWNVRKNYGRLTVEQGDVPGVQDFMVVVKVPGRTPVDSIQREVVTVVKPGLVKDKLAGIGKVPAKASINKATLAGRKLHVRSWRKGDRMKPFGMTGSKKLQDIFIDGKVPAEERARIPVFECGGEIVWVPGYRVAQGWEVRDSSAPALQIELRS